jgi:hypothetical protein
MRVASVPRIVVLHRADSERGVSMHGLIDLKKTRPLTGADLLRGLCDDDRRSWLPWAAIQDAAGHNVADRVFVKHP